MSCALDLLQGHITLSIAQKVHAALLMASIIAHLYVLGVRLRPIGPGRIETDVRTIQLPAVHPICGCSQWPSVAVSTASYYARISD